MTSATTQADTQQLLRTVEMFEAITETQPDDYQSLEILKEAYDKLGREGDRQRTVKKLARAYIAAGQASQAILEYQALLAKAPEDEEVRAALLELKAPTPPPNPTISRAPSPGAHSKPTPPTPTLVIGAGASSIESLAKGAAEADQALANALIAGKLVTPQAAKPLLQRLKDERPASVGKAQPLTLLQMLVDDQIAKMEDLLSLLVEKTGLPYLPLSIYDADRDLGARVSAEFCLYHAVVPFDTLSRSALVATANPFDAAAREQMKALLNQNVFWYLTSPAEITTAIRSAHGIDARGNTKRSGPKP